MDYAAFLAEKRRVDPPTGLQIVPALHPELAGFQRDVTGWALKRGRAGIFAGTGLGKTFIELSWAEAVADYTGGIVMLFAPPAVAMAQIVPEAKKWGFRGRLVEQQEDCRPGINIASLKKFHRFQPRKAAGVGHDESSILKSYDGHYRTSLISSCSMVPFRLAATATPAPNDFMELGNHAEFLGAMSYTDMLSTFFVHDGSQTQKWRLKGHAEAAFWRWLASFCVMLRMPSDLGYADGAYVLPPPRQVQHTVRAAHDPAATGTLFAMEARTMRQRLQARRDTVAERVAMAASITPDDRPFAWWCNLNSESEALARAIPGAVEIRGSDTEDDKERKILDFIQGRVRVVVSKASITGYGLNFQHCADTGFVGLNDSWEQVYQAVRRFWRFGQARPVTAHFIAAETEGAVVANLKRKEADAERMASAMVAHMADLGAAAIRGAERDRPVYAPAQALALPSWIGSAA